MTPEQKRSNFRLAMVLVSIAGVFMLGIFVKMAFLSA